MCIIKLTGERAWRTYIGGRLIDELHGKFPGEDSHFPEEWIMSITECRNAGREDVKNEGMSRDVKTGRMLSDIIKEDPSRLLGKRHYERFGATTGVLIKLIDSAERLSIQVHPDKEKAKKYFGSEYGKTESWHILGTRKNTKEKPCIYLGFKEGIDMKKWREIFDSQDIKSMLSCLNRIEVKEGDTYLIKGGVPHAIGAGCFLIEVQEPTDYTLRTERVTESGFKIADVMCHQGIGFDNMMDCFNYGAADVSKYRLIPRENGSETVLIDHSDTDCFKLSELNIKDEETLEPEDTFYGLYILSGAGRITEDGDVTEIKTGDQLFVSAETKAKITADEKIKAAKFSGPLI